MAEIKVKVGTKVEDQEKLDNLKPSEIGKFSPTPPPGADVEAQYPIYRYVICPWCGAGGSAWLDTDYWTTLYCWNCNGPFEA